MLKLTALLLLLTSCAPMPERWHLSRPNTFNGKICLPVRDGLSIEFIHSCGTEWGYINNCAFGFAEQTIPITLTIEGVSYRFLGQRLEGCQRVLMPPQATQLLIRSLLDEHSVHLVAGPYQTLLQAHNFAHLYGKLK